MGHDLVPNNVGALSVTDLFQSEVSRHSTPWHTPQHPLTPSMHAHDL